MKIRKGIGLSVILIVLDQFIKLFIYYFAMDKKMKLALDFIYFTPVFNENISWASAKTGLKVGLMPHIIVSIAIIIVFILLGVKYYHKYADRNYMIIAYFMTLAGMICSAIDRIFWGSSLDYIEIKGCFIFDLKDVLISALYVLYIGIIKDEIQNAKIKQEIR